MKILKKLISLFLCGALTTISPLYAEASDIPNISVSESASSITENMKGAGAYIKWIYNSSETYARNGQRAIYDVHVKYDTGKFDSSDYTTVITPLSGKIESVRCILEHEDGSYTSPEIIGFEPNQIDSLQLEFAQNGVYTLYATASSGTTAKSKIDVVEVSDPKDPNDSTPPEITDKIIERQPGRSVTFNIESNELCRLEINGTVYSECTGVNYTITEAGQYKVTATDLNGNTSSKIIAINDLGGSIATTAAPIPTTTTTTTTTTTSTSTTESTTTTTTSSTTTDEPTTTTTSTSTTESTTTTTTSSTTTDEPTTTTTSTSTTESTTTTTTSSTTTDEPTTTTTSTTESTTTTTTADTTTYEPPMVTTTVPHQAEYSIAPIDENELYAGNTVTLNYICSDGQFPQVWWVESSDYDVASCQNGYDVSLKNEGTVTLTAHCANNINVSITFNVKSAKPIETTTAPVPPETTVTTVASTISTETASTAPPVTEPVYTLGDVNGDGAIDSSDASDILIEYAKKQTGKPSFLTDTQKKSADVNNDGIIDPSDASLILIYYSDVSTGKRPSFN